MIRPVEHAIDNLRNAPEDEQGRVSLDLGDRDLVVEELDRLRAVEGAALTMLRESHSDAEGALDRFEAAHVKLARAIVGMPR